MIKKIAVAAVFAVSSMSVGVPPASASPMVCYMQWVEAFNACEGNATCQVAADIAYSLCLQALAAEIS